MVRRCPNLSTTKRSVQLQRSGDGGDSLIRTLPSSPLAVRDSLRLKERLAGTSTLPPQKGNTLNVHREGVMSRDPRCGGMDLRLWVPLMSPMAHVRAETHIWFESRFGRRRLVVAHTLPRYIYCCKRYTQKLALILSIRIMDVEMIMTGSYVHVFRGSREGRTPTRFKD